MTPLLASAFAGLSLLSSASAGVVSADRSRDGAGGADVWEPRRVAVLIGVQDYSDPTLNGLKFPEKDARDLGDVLQAEDVGGFDHVFVISGAASTTAEGIRRALAVATADLQRDDTFFLYLSGHGTLTIDPREGSKLWFLPSDARLANPEDTGIAIAELENLVNAQPARRRVLVMDTCHNGRDAGSLSGRSAVNDPTAQLLAGLRGEAPAPRSLRAVSESEARLFAAQYHQPAMEDPALENGVYTHFLLDALTTGKNDADLDRDGLVDVVEAHDYARDHTIRHTGGIQVPRAEYRIVGHEEIYLSGDPSRRSSAEQALLTACDEILSKARLLVDGTPRGAMPGLTAIDPGRHRLELQDASGAVLARKTVHLDAGATLPIETLLDGTRGSQVTIGLGTVSHHGAAQPWFHAVTPELELQWLEPVHLSSRWRPVFHVRTDGWRGTVGEQGDPAGSLPITAGSTATGLSLGLRWKDWSLGPQGELLIPWRVFEDYGATETLDDSTALETSTRRQMQATAAVGGRLLWTRAVGDQVFALRADSRWAPYTVDTTRLGMWHHGVSLAWAPSAQR
ncbi:MAG: hypothetical protein CL927_01015 [Deltaproteobacteria bacterium]|nr:hypothetical protein [Deltaproteobacteria bacterium]